MTLIVSPAVLCRPDLGAQHYSLQVMEILPDHPELSKLDGIPGVGEGGWVEI